MTCLLRLLRQMLRLLLRVNLLIYWGCYACYAYPRTYICAYACVQAHTRNRNVRILTRI